MFNLFFYRNPDVVYNYDYVMCRFNYKYSVLIFCYIFGFIGSCLTSVGMWLLFDEEQYAFLKNESWFSWDEFMLRYSMVLPYLMIAVGVTMYCGGVLSATACILEDIKKIISFNTALTIFYLISILFGTWILVIKDSASQRMQDKIKGSSTKFEVVKAAELFLNALESRFQCCGGLEYDDGGVTRKKSDCDSQTKNNECKTAVPNYLRMILLIIGIAIVTSSVFGLVVNFLIWNTLIKIQEPEQQVLENQMYNDMLLLQ